MKAARAQRIITKASIQAFAQKLTGKGILCHHATLAILRFVALNDSIIPSTTDANRFGITLMDKRHEIGEAFDPKRLIPPNLYDVFGFFRTQGGFIAHSSLVIEPAEEGTLANWNNKTKAVDFIPFTEILKYYSGFLGPIEITAFSLTRLIQFISAPEMINPKTLTSLNDISMGK